MSQFELFAFDSEGWRDEYNEAIDTRQLNVVRNLRVSIFKSTVSIVNAGKYMAGNQVVSPFCDEEMQKGTVFYKSPIDMSQCNGWASTRVEYSRATTRVAPTERAGTRPAPTEATIVSVINEDCLVVSEYLKFLGYNPAVLNMASATNPGGGVTNGSGAQEENLFRRSNIYRSLYRYAHYAGLYGLEKATEQYPLDRNRGGIYTPSATVFRGKESDGYPLLPCPFKMSFITVPAVSRPDIDSNGRLTPKMIELTKNKMRTIFRIALKNGHDALVLGAMGCGAFRNPPSHIAELFHEVIEEPEFKDKLRRIVFAIIDDHNAHLSHNPEGNYLPFAREFMNADDPTGVYAIRPYRYTEHYGRRQAAPLQVDVNTGADKRGPYRYLAETKYAAQIIKIRQSAHKLHESVNQWYGSSLPYSIHLDMVARATMDYAHLVCKEEEDIVPIMFAAFYHDSIEDARLTYNDVKRTALTFMDENQATLAAELVYALSNDKGKTRAERGGDKYYNGICEVPYGPLIKLADRLANIKFSASQAALGKGKMKDVYAKELPHMLECIKSRHAADDIRYAVPEEMIEACRKS